MDPNAALAELRKLAETQPDTARATRMAELFQGLDRWITRGGFLPREWKPRPRPTVTEELGLRKP